MTAAASTTSAPTRGEVVIVPLAAAHLDQVLAIEERVATTGWSREVFERELSEAGSRCYRAAVLPTLRAPSVLGYAGVQLQVDEAHFTTVTVAPHARRRGIATRLLVELLREARARGATAATLEVRVDNRPARALYTAFGFRPVGLRPRYYEGRRDALIMWAHDLDGAEYGRLLRAREASVPTVPPDGQEEAR